MTPQEFPKAFIRFIHRSLPTYSATELLICVARDSERTWTIDEVLVAIPGLTRDAISEYLLHFLRVEILREETESHYRYDPKSAEDRAAVAMLIEAYEHRPVTLIRTIYSIDATKIQSFADSFKLKRD